MFEYPHEKPAPVQTKLDLLKKIIDFIEMLCIFESQHFGIKPDRGFYISGNKNRRDICQSKTHVRLSFGGLQEQLQSQSAAKSLDIENAAGDFKYIKSTTAHRIFRA
jgi:hypothetical protein